MATFELPTGVLSTEFQQSGKSDITITKVMDDSSGSVLNVGDSVTVTWINQGVAETFSADFVGTLSVNVSGQDRVFMVLKDDSLGSTLYYVIGLKADDALATIVETGMSVNITAESFTVCFFPGTLIATPSGERKVEKLVAGDIVLTKDGREIPVKFAGRQTVSIRFGPTERLMPVRIAAGSLGGGGGQPLLPHSELTVTADHALLVDGVLCEAGTLVNGTTITRAPLSEFGDSYTVYHVETEAHEIILANGAPAETFVDNVSRRAFDNFAEFEALHGDPPEMKELSYPQASNARYLPARIKARLGIDLRVRQTRRTAS